MRMVSEEFMIATNKAIGELQLQQAVTCKEMEKLNERDIEQGGINKELKETLERLNQTLTQFIIKQTENNGERKIESRLNTKTLAWILGAWVLVIQILANAYVGK